MRQSVGRFGELITLRTAWTLAALAAMGVWSGGVGVKPAQAQTLLEETGTIVPAESRYTFEGTAGQSVTVTLASDDFDSVVSLQNEAGEEIAANDDFGGTLNSTVIITLPEDGTYTVVARSFAGNGGDYELAVRISTPFEVAYGEAQGLAQEGQYEAAIAAFSDAIAIDSNQPSAYLGRAEAYLSQIYIEQEDGISSPQDIPEATRLAIISDFESAADLIAASGNQDWANSLREQAEFLRSGEENSEAAPESM